MKALFVYPSPILGEAPLGILYLSSMLKSRGHETRLFHTTKYKLSRAFGFDKEIQIGFRNEVANFKPNLIAYSVDETQYQLALKMTKAIDLFQIPNIFGGIYPTVAPETVFKEPLVDNLCIGEGEQALLELVENFDLPFIDNLWRKTRDQTFRNPLRPLNQDLDSLPYPDREILPPEVLQNKTNGINFITSRGCPYSCPYCTNEALRKVYRGKGHWVRFRKIEKVIEEIQSTVARYHPERITFSDETFTFNKKRLLEFLALYKREIGLPFLCQTHIGNTDFETFRALKEAGCETVNMGIESGNPHIRNSILERGMGNSQIEASFSMCRRLGLKTGSFNMVGIPSETESDVWDTINLNRELQPNVVMCTVYMPLQHTKLGESCLKEGSVKQQLSGDYYTSSAYHSKSLSSRKATAYAVLFPLYVKSSRKALLFLWILRKFTELLAFSRGLITLEKYTLEKLGMGKE